MNYKSEKPLRGKVAIVTGSTRGLGKGMALALAEAGANIVVTGRTEEALHQVSQEIREKKVESLPVKLDVKDPSSIKEMVKKVVEKFSRIDILVNNAGTIVRKPALDVTLDEWETVVNTILRGAFLCSQEVAKVMIEKKIKGKIINIGSETSKFGIPGIIAYVAARGGIAQLTKGLAVEWAKYNICVNCIAPGYFETAQTKPLFSDKEWVSWVRKRIPMGREGDAMKDLNGTVVFLASDASDYITGQIIFVDGGLSASLF